MNTLPRTFYSRDTVKVARDLLGKTLVRRIGKQAITGIITETEAYCFGNDPASHAHRGITERNKAMFGEVGRAYVYFTYGMYYCVNAVARNNKNDAGAVLVRAIKPEKGVLVMMKNRKKNSLVDLTNGPAKITQALKIDKKQYGEDLTTKSNLFITEGLQRRPRITASPRIGIRNATEKLWNFKIQI